MRMPAYSSRNLSWLMARVWRYGDDSMSRNTGHYLPPFLFSVLIQSTQAIMVTDLLPLNLQTICKSMREPSMSHANGVELRQMLI